MLREPDPAAKTGLALELAACWRDGRLSAVGGADPPDRPGRPDKPVLTAPRDMPKRGRARSRTGRVALLHALAHIELNAVDLACDLIARFGGASPPRAFLDDWVSVADDEASHFRLLAARLAAFGAAYGDLPAHDGLWQAAEATRHDLLARLAIVPLVLEARGLDVTPAMIANLDAAGDAESADALRTIYREEIRHVAIGRTWFAHVCKERGEDPETAFHREVRAHFKGSLKPPFNEEARGQAGLTPGFYKPLSVAGAG